MIQIKSNKHIASIYERHTKPRILSPTPNPSTLRALLSPRSQMLALPLASDTGTFLSTEELPVLPELPLPPSKTKVTMGAKQQQKASPAQTNANKCVLNFGSLRIRESYSDISS